MLMYALTCIALFKAGFASSKFKLRLNVSELENSIQDSSANAPLSLLISNVLSDCTRALLLSSSSLSLKQNLPAMRHHQNTSYLKYK